MLSPELRCVVGIDIATGAQVGCALDAPDGRVRQRPRRLAATAEGHAQLLAWRADWGAAAAILSGLEATGPRWAPRSDALTAAGYTVLVRTPRQTAAWARRLGRRAQTDARDAQTLALGRRAGLARASTLPSAALQALRALTRTRRELVEERPAARQRLHDEVAVLGPEFVRLVARWPGTTDRGAPAVLGVLTPQPSAQVVARADPAALSARLGETSAGRWGVAAATALATAATHSVAGTRAVAARGLVVRTLARQRLARQQRVAALAAAMADLLRDAADGQRRQPIPGIGPHRAATLRAALGDVSRFQGVDQVIAYAGLDPRTRQSGAFVGPQRRAKRGPGALRHALYRAAFVAARARPEWQVRYQRLLDRGRGANEARVILSRALLKLVYHLLRTGETYDPASIKPLPSTAGA